MPITYHANLLTAEAYTCFQCQMGWPSDPLPQVERALANSLHTITAMLDGEVIGMGRLVGDAAMYWYIQDVFILTPHQGKGLGTAIVRQLMAYAKAQSLPGTGISIALTAAKGKEGFYERLGFRRATRCGMGTGMSMEITIPTA